MDDQLQAILIQCPFLTYGTFIDTSYLGIVQNCDAQLLSMYVLNAIQTEAERKEFIAAGESWWWGSNRQIPINIFLKERFRPYRACLKHFSRKDFIIEAGPIVSLQDTITKRVRKRQITLVQRMP